MYIQSNNQLSNIPAAITQIQSYNNMNRLGAVGEYFAFEGLLDWFYATVTGDSYSQAISKIVERTNYNKGVKCFPVQSSQDCFDNAEVKTIINTYGNLVTLDGMIEYDREKYPQYVTGIEQLVAEKSGMPLMSVKIVLADLYYGTKDGTIKFSGILRPRTYAENAKYTIKAEKDKGGLEKWWENLPSLTTITYLLGGILVVGGGLYIYSWLPKNR